MGYPLKRECKQKKNQILIFTRSESVYKRVSAYRNVYINTEFDWKVKWGITKVSISRAVRLRVSISGELIVVKPNTLF